MTTLRWEDPAWRADAEDWIHAHAEVTGAVEVVRIRPWSCVLSVPTQDGVLYFKEQQESLAHEVRLIEVLARHRAALVTEVLVSGERGRMLMRDAGRQLSDVLATDLDVRYWEEALPLYAELQIEAAPDVDELAEAGVFDRRCSVLPRRYEDLVAERTPGLTDSEYRRLRELIPDVRRFCAAAAELAVPETIQNDDFTDGSIFLRDGAYRFVDWGDACVSHPFFTLTVTQRIIEIRHGLAAASPEIARVRAAYLEPFTRFEPRGVLEELVEPARQFGQICRSALQDETGWDTEPDALAWSLRLLLDPEAWRGWSE